MNGLGMRNRLRPLAATALPSLRVIGMAYTGLFGVVAVVLVVSVAFLPVGEDPKKVKNSGEAKSVSPSRSAQSTPVRRPRQRRTTQ